MNSEQQSLWARTKARLAELGVEPKRSLGQNFLVSNAVVARIVDAVNSQNPQHLIEVGPGVGALTEELIKIDSPLALVELDSTFASYWQTRGLSVNEGDALKIDWSQLNLPAGTVLVSNLPYQISTHIVVERCLGPEAISAMVLMFQKEVAQRFNARPRSEAYGLLSVMAQSHFSISKVCDAGPRDFKPPPKVASQVLLFKRLDFVYPGQSAKFLTFLKVAFAQRRKLLSKNLLAIGNKSTLNQKAIEVLLEELGVGAKARAEELSVDQFLQLFKMLGLN